MLSIDIVFRECKNAFSRFLHWLFDQWSEWMVRSRTSITFLCLCCGPHAPFSFSDVMCPHPHTFTVMNESRSCAPVIWTLRVCATPAGCARARQIVRVTVVSRQNVEQTQQWRDLFFRIIAEHMHSSRHVRYYKNALFWLFAMHLILEFFFGTLQFV